MSFSPARCWREAESIAEIRKEGDAELPAGLHQPEHDIAGLAANGAHCTPRDPALGHAGAQVIFRGIGVKRDLRSPQYLQQFGLAAVQAGQQRLPVPVSGQRVCRIMQAHNLLLARKYTERPEHVHGGKVIVMRSDLRWCSDGFEFTCWNGDIVRGAFLIDAHDREVIALAGRGQHRDQRLGHPRHHARSRRTPIRRIPRALGHRDAVRQRLALHREGDADLRPPARSEALLHTGSEPTSNGISEAFVKTLKRDYVQVTPLPDAQTVLGLIGGWIEDYNDNHPHSELKMRSPREFIAAQTATA